MVSSYLHHYKNTLLIDIYGEEWVDVVGFNGRYKISNKGRIKVMNRQNRGYSEIMKQQKGTKNGGYLLIQLYKNNKPYTYSVSRLVAKHFVDNPKNHPEVNHENGDKLDNESNNLTWTDRIGNIHHSLNVLGNYTGIKNANSKFSKQEVMDIFLAKGTHREIANKYKVNHSVVGRIKSKQTYKNILNGIDGN